MTYCFDKVFSEMHQSNSQTAPITYSSPPTTILLNVTLVQVIWYCLTSGSCIMSASLLGFAQLLPAYYKLKPQKFKAF